MTTSTGSDALLAAVEQLRERAGATTLPLGLDGVAAARRERDALVGQLDDYVLPRLRAADAPLLAVVGGSTGAGKSTLVNSLLRRTVSQGGVLRPTTRAPVLVHHPDDRRWFEGTRVLPTLARTTGAPAVTGRDLQDVAPITTVHLTPSDAVPPGLALLDAPDIDSVVAANRELAQQLLAAADLWLFVTSAARYADAVPWALLQGAASRGAAVAVVLDRVPPPAVQQVRAHLAEMLREHGLSSAPLFVVAESRLDAAGMLPTPVVAPVLDWLWALARDDSARQAVVRRTLTGWLDTMTARTDGLVSALSLQRLAHERLRVAAAESYTQARRDVDEALSDGSLLRGEILARWQEVVGTGELLQSLQERVGGWRDRLGAALRGRPRQAPDLGVALQTGVEQLVRAHAEAAAEQAARRWRSVPGGPALLQAHPELERAGDDVVPRTARLVRDWQGAVLELVREEGGDRRATARALSYGVNGLGVLLMLVVFSQTAGLSGAEVGIAGGTALLAQRVLEAVFGDQAVRTLAGRARTDLVARAGTLLDEDHARYTAVLVEASAVVDVAALERAAHEVERARRGRAER